jgi:hypothetical protein
LARSHLLAVRLLLTAQGEQPRGWPVPLLGQSLLLLSWRQGRMLPDQPPWLQLALQQLLLLLHCGQLLSHAPWLHSPLP